ncbi:hypothetical protein TeGR_g11476, partial [Tetraparma gracilis]
MNPPIPTPSVPPLSGVPPATPRESALASAISSAEASLRQQHEQAFSALRKELKEFAEAKQRQPNMVINRVSSPSFVAEPHFTTHASSTLLFADISGYTALAQSLGAAGAEGTEALSSALDNFFGIAISSIYRFGGDVIKFCGDAILCVFQPDRTTSPDQAALAAAKCSLELKSKLRFFKAGKVELDLKQMLAFGDIIGNYVGDKTLNHFEFLTTGQPLKQIAETEHYVEPGDIILSREIYDVLGDQVVVKDVSVEAAARGFKLLMDTNALDSGVASSLSGIHGDSVRELNAAKNVRLASEKQAILEMFNEPYVVEKLTGFAGSWSRLERSSSSMRSRVSRHDLCTIMFTDDKGTVAIIVFSGRESNTISACRCALGIKENFEGYDISSGIGIATGKVFFGPVGDERRCEMAWIGDSVNLSARLMGKAKDTIMVDKATSENACGECAFEMFGMVELKGKGAVAL